MWHIIVSTVIKSLFAYLYLMFLSRILGRKLISQMTFFNFIVGITMGSLGADLAINGWDESMSSGVAMAVLVILALLTDFISIKSMRFRKFVQSHPVTVIDKGVFIENNMRSIRLSIDELNMKLREKNIFNFIEVELAVMETDGQLSVLSKFNKSPVPSSELRMNKASSGLMKDIIMDSEIMEENLYSGGLDKEWLMHQLNSIGIKSISEIFYAGIDNDKKLYFSKRTK
ncbi:DUF421 domain-containing protein [Clostridium sp. 19966]|uniref:DUF421 domain-containing protein n=1 Tax=Clostridium sp. 19966 TaxID=2768166 RepID=UPI0028DE422A|nr:DUF421 domain-containing protein [Clostridium sp. 19966]MDT8717100.1 DUF421 domain-containing protein [Clostridium sp. 19966]